MPCLVATSLAQSTILGFFDFGKKNNSNVPWSRLKATTLYYWLILPNNSLLPAEMATFYEQIAAGIRPSRPQLLVYGPKPIGRWPTEQSVSWPINVALCGWVKYWFQHIYCVFRDPFCSIRLWRSAKGVAVWNKEGIWHPECSLQAIIGQSVCQEVSWRVW